MKSAFRKINPKELQFNPFTLIVKDWFLVTAGPPDSFNTLTAGWGGLGVLWNKDVVMIVIRPTRYTYEFLESNDTFTCAFFENEHKRALQLLGQKSGRDGDKVAESGLTPIPGMLEGTTSFAEAHMVMECRKIYFQDLDPTRFLDPLVDTQWYPEKDYHRMYVGEIVNCLVKPPVRGRHKLVNPEYAGE